MTSETYYKTVDNLEAGLVAKYVIKCKLKVYSLFYTFDSTQK